MRNIIIAALAGVALGTTGTLLYSHYFYPSPAVPPTSEDAPHPKPIAGDNQQLKNEIDAMSAQIQQLSDSNEDLQKQLDEAKKAAVPAPPPQPTFNPMMFAGMFRGVPTQQRLLLLKSRLHLTPDQQKAVQAALDADAKQRQDLMRQMFRGGQPDPQAATKLVALDQTLAGILTPDQLAAYKQVQNEEKTSQADTRATAQVDQVAPLLQLSDAQRDQVYNELYQAQIQAPDPVTLATNPNASSAQADRAKALDNAMAKILTSEQYTLYKQQEQYQPRLGPRGGGGR